MGVPSVTGFPGCISLQRLEFTGGWASRIAFKWSSSIAWDVRARHFERCLRAAEGVREWEQAMRSATGAAAATTHDYYRRELRTAAIWRRSYKRLSHEVHELQALVREVSPALAGEFGPTLLVPGSDPLTSSERAAQVWRVRERVLADVETRPTHPRGLAEVAGIDYIELAIIAAHKAYSKGEKFNFSRIARMTNNKRTTLSSNKRFMAATESIRQGEREERDRRESILRDRQTSSDFLEDE